MKPLSIILGSLIFLSSSVIFAQSSDTASQAASVVAPTPEVTKIDTVVGTGEEAKMGHRVRVHYSGWLYDPVAPNRKGKPFDSSLERGPFDFQIGVSRVIKGWQEGVQGMKVGGKRTLIIPPELAYGPRAMGNVIPAYSTLVFDIELLQVLP